MDLRNCDCLEFLSTLDNDSVDLVVVDPPYFRIMKDRGDDWWLNGKSVTKEEHARRTIPIAPS